MTLLDGVTYTYDPMNLTKNRTGDGSDWAAIYTADDERLAVWDTAKGVVQETWSLRGLDGLVLREFFFGVGLGGELIFADGFEHEPPDDPLCAWTQMDGMGPDCEGSGPGDPTWSVHGTYVYRNGVLLADYNGGDIRNYHLDHLGSVRQITDEGGAVAEGHDYLPYGTEVPGSSAGLRFTGHERDGHLAGSGDDLDYMHARYCSPGLGRFLSVDPNRSSGVRSRPQSWNRYSYALDNPLVFADADGEAAHVVVGGVVGGILNASAQAIRNHSQGKPLGTGVLKAAGVGFVAGAVGAATFGVGLAIGAESVTAVVLSGAAGGALGGAVQGAGNERVVEGNQDVQQVTDAAVQGAVIGGATGLLGGVLIAPKIGTIGAGALADALEIGVAQGVATEASAVADLALEVGKEITEVPPRREDEEPRPR